MKCMNFPWALPPCNLTFSPAWLHAWEQRGICQHEEMSYSVSTWIIKRAGWWNKGLPYQFVTNYFSRYQFEAAAKVFRWHFMSFKSICSPCSRNCFCGLSLHFFLQQQIFFLLMWGLSLPSCLSDRETNIRKNADVLSLMSRRLKTSQALSTHFLSFLSSFNFYPFSLIGLCWSLRLQKVDEKWSCVAAPKHINRAVKWFQDRNSSSCFRSGAILAEEDEGLFCAFTAAPASLIFQSKTVQSWCDN